MDIGSKIKSLRLKNQLTLEDVANRCELSKGFLSQVENNLSSPSIATLEDILEVLGSSLSDFFKADEPEENVIVCTNDDYFENEQEEYKILYLVPNAQKNLMEPIHLTLMPKGKSEDVPPHDGEDFGFVLEGEITICYGEEKILAKTGDSFYIYCNENYYLYNGGIKEAKLLWVSSPPYF
ncbi:MAG: cupin domain-containing protein [Ruminococcaceae bacterium]|nr:cupin domain-containing protein [Oscillospiraceae bacterium]